MSKNTLLKTMEVLPHTENVRTPNTFVDVKMGTNRYVIISLMIEIDFIRAVLGVRVVKIACFISRLFSFRASSPHGRVWLVENSRTGARRADH